MSLSFSHPATVPPSIELDNIPKENEPTVVEITQDINPNQDPGDQKPMALIKRKIEQVRQRIMKSQFLYLSILSYGAFRVSFVEGIIIPLLPRFLNQFGLDDTQVTDNSTIMLAILWCCSLITTSLMGYFLDHLKNRQPVFVLSCIADIIASILLAFTHYIVGYGAAMGLIGFGVSAFLTSAFAISADLWPVEERDKSVSIVFTAFAAGNLIGPLIGGVMADHLFLEAPQYLAIALSSLDLLLRLLVLDPPRRMENSSKFKDVIKNKPIVSFLILSVLMNFSMEMTFTMFNVRSLTEFGDSAQTVGTFIFIGGTGNIFGGLLPSILQKIKIQKYAIISMGVFVTASLSLAAPFLHNFYLLAGVNFLVAFSSSIIDSLCLPYCVSIGERFGLINVSGILSSATIGAYSIGGIAAGFSVGLSSDYLLAAIISSSLALVFIPVFFIVQHRNRSFG